MAVFRVEKNSGYTVSLYVAVIQLYHIAINKYFTGIDGEATRPHLLHFLLNQCPFFCGHRDTQHNVPRSVCHSFTVLFVSNKGWGLSQQAMPRQGLFRECGYTPYTCCGISFLTTTTVNTLHFSKPIRKVTERNENSRRILEKLRIFVYNIYCIIVYVRKERRMKGYLSIRETSYKWGISERRVNQYCAQGRIPMKRSLPSS